MLEVTANAPKVERELTVNYDFGDTLDAAKKLFGEEVVMSIFKAKAVIIIQDMIRRNLGLKKTDEEITKMVAEYKLGVVAVRAGKSEEKFIDGLAKKSPEAQAAFIAKLKAKIAEAKNA